MQANKSANKPQASKLIAPPAQASKPLDAPLSGLIVIIKVQDDGIKIIPSIPKNAQSDIFALKFNVSYRIDLDEKKIEYGNRQQVKPFISRDKKKKGFFGSFKKDKPIQTSTLVVFVNEQYDEQSNVAHYQFSEKLDESNKIPRIKGTSDLYIEARTNKNKRSIMKGGGRFNLALNMIKKQAANIGNALKGPAKEMGKDIAKEKIQNKLGGKFPDLIGDAKKLVKYTLYLPANGYKAIQNKAKELYKEIKGGNHAKAKKCCDDIQKQCAKKCNKQKGGGCGCKGKCHCKKPGQCGGGKEFNIYSKANQEFGKKLKKRYNDKADKLKAQIKAIQKFKGQLKKLPAKDFNAKLKSQKNKSNQQKKNEMIKRQDKKIAKKKQAIKDHEQEIYGMFR